MIGVYGLTNCSSVVVEDIIHDIDDYVLARLVIVDSDKPKRAYKYKVYYDDNSRAFFNFGGAKIYLDEVLRTD